MSSSTIRREIHPEMHVLDDRAGLVEYVASDETLDADNEVMRANGARFDRFAKNSPLVDSHRYDSIERCVGKVVDFRVDGDRLIETAKWAIDVPENKLAQLGFKMTEAGYLKAVSIGFYPEEVVTAASPRHYAAQLAELHLEGKMRPSKIFTKWQQLELTVCLLPSNPNALAMAAKAYKDGVLSGALIDGLQRTYPEFGRSFEQILQPGGRSYSFPSEHRHTDITARSNMKSVFLSKLGQLTADMGRNTPGSHRTIDRPETRQAPGFLTRLLHCTTDEATKRLFREVSTRTALVPGAGLGSGLVPTEVADSILDVSESSGAYVDFTIQRIGTGYTQALLATATPKGVFRKPDAMGTQVSPDAVIAGGGVNNELRDLICMLEYSPSLSDDSKGSGSPIESVLTTLSGKGHAGRIDWACFAADGTDDEIDGGQTGIFAHTTIPSVSAGAGHTAVGQLSPDDFLSVIDAVADSALARNPRWWLAPGIYKKMLHLRDGDNQRLIQFTPAGPMLFGHPIRLVSCAPNVNEAGAKIIAFGSGEAYLVALGTDLRVGLSNSEKFDYNLRQFRMVTRVHCQCAEPTWFATLKLAAQ